MAKTPCPVTREQFWADAQAVTIEINGVPMTADPKEFSTGSLGWYLNGKTSIKIGGTSVPVQIGTNITVIGSKETSSPKKVPLHSTP